MIGYVRRQRLQRVRSSNPEPRPLNPMQASGQAMVEMALVMGILLLVILGGDGSACRS